MTEANQVWKSVREHLAPFGRVQRLEHAHEVGWPDVVYTVRNCTGFLELKVAPASGRCPDHLTRDQVAWGKAEHAAGGKWHLLAKLDSGIIWVLLNCWGAEAWLEGGNLSYATPLVSHAGRFPTREVLDIIAPLPARTFDPYDALMEGPRFRSWNMSVLDRLRLKLEGERS